MSWYFSISELFWGTNSHISIRVSSCVSFVDRRRTDPAGNLAVPLHGAVAVGVTGVEGQSSARLPREAACCLVAKETWFTASTFV